MKKAGKKTKAREAKIRGSAGPQRASGQAAARKAPEDTPPLPAEGVKSLTAVLDPLIARLSRLSEVCLAARTVLNEAAKLQPQTQACPCGPAGQPHELDLDASSRASYGRQSHVWVYRPCPLCVQIGEKPWFVRAGAPSKLIEATLESWKPRLASDLEVAAAIGKFVLSFRGLMVLTGPVGTGKSHLAVALMKKFGCGRFISQNTILMKLRATYRNDRAEDIVESCKAAKFLALDELGDSTGSKDEFPALYEIVNHRYNEDLPTVITSNIDPDAFPEIFGDRLADRLCACVRVRLKGPSWRKKEDR